MARKINIGNLKPITNVEQAREMGKKGGKASQKAQKAKKTFQELANLIINSKAQYEDFDKVVDTFPEIEKENIINSAVILEAMFQKAKQGDKGAAEFIRDSSGNKPTDKTESKTETIVVHLTEKGVKETGFAISELMEAIRNDRKI